VLIRRCSQFLFKQVQWNVYRYLSLYQYDGNGDATATDHKQQVISIYLLKKLLTTTNFEHCYILEVILIVRCFFKISVQKQAFMARPIECPLFYNATAVLRVAKPYGPLICWNSIDHIVHSRLYWYPGSSIVLEQFPVSRSSLHLPYYYPLGFRTWR
jgi:hypothetical protein